MPPAPRPRLYFFGPIHHARVSSCFAHLARLFRRGDPWLGGRACIRADTSPHTRPMPGVVVRHGRLLRRGRPRPPANLPSSEYISDWIDCQFHRVIGLLTECHVCMRRSRTPDTRARGAYCPFEWLVAGNENPELGPCTLTANAPAVRPTSRCTTLEVDACQSWVLYT